MYMIKKFLSSQWAQYTPFGQFLFVLALAATVVDAGVAYKYGTSMTFLHGVGFALMACAFAVLLDVAGIEWAKRKFTASLSIAGVWLVLGLVLYQSHIGYGAGVRVTDMQQTVAHNTMREDGRKSLADMEAKIKLLEDNRVRLDADMAKLVAINVGSWSVAVAPASPEALDGMIAAKKLEAENEKNRKGCKAKCEARNQELAHLEALRATAVKIDENHKQHTATIKALADARTSAGRVMYASSTVVNQNDTFAQLWNAAIGLEPEKAINPTDTMRRFVNIFTSGTTALGFLILAPILMFAAGRNRCEREHSPETVSELPAAAEPMIRDAEKPRPVMASIIAQGDKAIRTTTKTIADIRNDLRRVATA